ncbi:Cyclin-like F-box [Cordyceps militaris]|uniref:Cyclin-like F-box n=1 Tax=Cordyceps militaris TaxID=73501 RepID=A0A2H4SGJ5_CORMI|nr:Cyclin-like F-box [Cordyceps militaris]
MNNTQVTKARSESVILERLPTEILVAILDNLPLKGVLNATLLCRRLHAVAVRTLQQRLLAVSSLPGYELILECYHPSLKIWTPYLCCRPVDTRHPDGAAAAADLRRVCQLYAVFRPVVTEENRRRPFRMVWPASVPGGGGSVHSADEAATQDLRLDEGELFSQLCVVLNLVTQGPRAGGLFVTHYNMSEHVVRVFRRWLGEMASRDDGDDGRPSWDAPPTTTTDKVPLASDRILWVDAARTIGLLFRVSLGPAERMPLISGADQDPAVSYTLTYQELIIRSTSLLMAVEASVSKEMEPSRNSIILSPAASRP